MKKNLDEQITVQFLKNLSFSKAIGVILLISGGAFLFLLWLIYIKEAPDTSSLWVEQLPALNAMLNGVSTGLILAGFRAVRQKRFIRHMKLMLTAFITSSLFLISYLIYHNFTGHTPFPGEGWIRPVYFTILISHIILSAFVVPLVLTSFYLAYSGKFKAHRRVSWWTFPIWLYVSVTGVMIFFILNAYT